MKFYFISMEAALRKVLNLISGSQRALYSIQYTGITIQLLIIVPVRIRLLSIFQLPALSSSPTFITFPPSSFLET